MKRVYWKSIAGVLLLTLVLGGMPLPIRPAQAAPVELFFSEYIEGSSNNKALEIYNGTGASVNLAAGAYDIQMYFNGNPSPTLTIGLTGVVANGDVYVLAHSSANAAILAQADQTNGAGWYNGDDAVVLRKGGVIIDSIGQAGFDPGSEWGAGLTSTADNTLRRKGTVQAGDANATDAFDPAVEWDGFATDTFDGLGSHTIIEADLAPTVTNTQPADGATGVPPASNVQITFSEPVDVSGDWFDMTCSLSGGRNLSNVTVAGGPTAYTLDPNDNFVDGDVCTVTVVAASITDQDTDDPPDAMLANYAFGFAVTDVCALPYTPIYDIQGSGLTTPLTDTLTTRGVVVGDYEGPSPALRGFYVQDAGGDGDPATSDGIFVFNGNNNSVSLGDVVRVTGDPEEFQGQTELGNASVVICGTSASVTPVDVTLPFPSADYPERYEGMLVRFPQTLFVTEHFQLGRFGMVVMSSGGRLQQPTNVVPPGPPAIALQAANNLNRIIVDDELNNQNPDPIRFGRGGNPLSAGNTLRGGDTATGTLGVMTYTWAGNSASGNAYRLRPVNALDSGVPDFQPTNPRPASPPAVGGSLTVTGMNLLNFFNTFDGIPDNVDNCTFGLGGAPADCRGADTQAEFDRQWPKTVAAILASGADVIGVNEIENDGYGPTSAIQFLVDRLNAATAPGTYAFVDVDAATGQVNALGTDAIKVGVLYKPASVTPVGATGALNTVAFVNGGDGAPRSRPALAQAFQQPNGARFVVTFNHLKSKGSPCDAPDAGDGQGNCNTVRLNAANELLAWLAGDPTGTGDPDVLIMGDLNSYAMEDPVTVIKNAGFTDLINAYGGPGSYSYVFDGQWGYLDHALGAPGILDEITGVADWHINSDEPSVLDYNTDFKTANLIATLYSPDQFRVSDHDAVLVGLNLNAPPVVGAPQVTPEPSLLGAAVTASAAFGDTEADDPYTCTVDYGDGSGPLAGTASGGVCTGPAHVYNAIGSYPVTVTVTDKDGETGSSQGAHSVIFDFQGFFPPVDNPPTINVVNAGRAIPVKFSLGGDQGLDIFAPGYPASRQIACDSGATLDTIEETIPAGSSQLTYKPETGVYTYAWKTQSSWRNTCRQLTVVLVDGTTHQAYFQFR